MSRGVRSVLKTAAMIAVPFVAAVAAPILAPVAAFGALGTAAVGSALGAGLGAGVGALTGRGAGTGALIGGLGGGLGAGLGATTGGLGGILPGYGTSTTGLAGGLLGSPFPASYAAAAGTGLPASITNIGTAAGLKTAATGIASGGLGGTATSLLSNLAGGITVPGLANLAMTLYNKPTGELTDTERAALMETAQLAQTDQELFKKRVEDAQMLRNMATPNPEQAFASASGAVQRAAREAERLGSSGSRTQRITPSARDTAIRATQAGATAAAQEQARGFEQYKSAMSAMPTETTKITPTTVALQFEQNAQKRQQMGEEQMTKAVGGLFGRAPSTGGAGLFESIYAPSGSYSRNEPYRYKEPTLRSMFG